MRRNKILIFLLSSDRFYFRFNLIYKIFIVHKFSQRDLQSKQSGSTWFHVFNKVRIRCRSKGLSITFFFKIRMLCSVKKIVNVKFLNFIKNDSDQLRTKNFTIFLFEIVKPKSCVTEFMNDALRERCLDFLFCFEKKSSWKSFIWAC